MKLTKLSALCLAASSMFAATSAMAWESADGAWSTSASVALSTDYIWRGVSQTDKQPAISGSFDVSHSSGAYAGIWSSNVDFGTETSQEIDFYAGFANDIADTGFSYDVGVLYYDYPGAASSEDLNFTELYGSLGYSFLTAGIAYTVDAESPDYEDSIYYSLDASYDVGAVSLAAGVGYYDYDAKSLEDYTNWHVGASTEFAGFGFDLTYTDNDISGSNSDAVVFTISKSL